MNLELTPYHFEQLHKKGYTLDVIFLLKMAEEGEDIDEFALKNTKLSTIHATLVRKGLYSLSKVTTEGKELLQFLSSPPDKELSITKPEFEGFERWWKAYPGTDTFEYKNRKFSGSRSLKAKKDECKLKFNRIIGEGDVKTQDLIDALELEVLQKKENSYKTGQNKLTYMQNSLTYLNQRSFESYVELVKAGHKAKEAPKFSGGVDI